MKLCRFELLDDPGTIRSGIIHNDTLYETDGQNPVGQHDPRRTRMFPPILQTAAIRAYDEGAQGGLDFRLLNPALLHGSNSRMELPVDIGRFDFDLRIAAAIKDDALRVDRAEAPDFILGYTLMLHIRMTEPEEDAPRGLQSEAAKDAGMFLGPSLTTPDEVATKAERAEATIFHWEYEIEINDTPIASGVQRLEVGMADILSQASAYRTAFAGELLALPPVRKPALDGSELGRPLLPDDVVTVTCPALGTLIAGFE